MEPSNIWYAEGQQTLNLGNTVDAAIIEKGLEATHIYFKPPLRAGDFCLIIRYGRNPDGSPIYDEFYITAKQVSLASQRRAGIRG